MTAAGSSSGSRRILEPVTTISSTTAGSADQTARSGAMAAPATAPTSRVRKTNRSSDDSMFMGLPLFFQRLSRAPGTRRYVAGAHDGRAADDVCYKSLQRELALSGNQSSRARLGSLVLPSESSEPEGQW